jgi:hypothetical protein
LAFRKEDLDAFMHRYRQVPMNTAAIVAKILGPSTGRRRRE